MSWVNKAISAGLLAVMVIMTVPASSIASDSHHKLSIESPAETVVCEDFEGTDQGQAPHSHCHCISQLCCSFLVSNETLSIEDEPQTKSYPLVSVSLLSWISSPPIRPPSLIYVKIIVLFINNLKK